MIIFLIIYPLQIFKFQKCCYITCFFITLIYFFVWYYAMIRIFFYITLIRKHRHYNLRTKLMRINQAFSAILGQEIVTGVCGK